MAKAQGPELTAKQTRLNIADLLASKSALRGFSDAERNVLRDVVEGQPGLNRAQKWGDKLRGGVPSLPSLGGAATALATGHPMLATGIAATAAVPPVVGAGLRSYANRGARRLADEAENVIRGQAPLARGAAFATAPGTFKVAPGAGAYSGGLIAAAMEARAREQAARQNIPQTYRVLPDGTVEELL